MKNTNKKHLSAKLLAGVLAASLTLGAGGLPVWAAEDAAETEELQELRIGVMTSGLDHWIAEIGIATGIYEAHGLDVEYTEFAAGVNTVDAIVTGQVDIGLLADYAAVNRIGNTQDNTDLRIIAHFARAAMNELYVNPEVITELSDLAGAGFLSLPGTVWDYWTAKTYEYAGIAEEDQNIINVDSQQTAVGALTTGEGDAFWASGTTAEKLAEAGLEPIFSLNDLGVWTDQYFITYEGYLEEHADTVQAFYEAVKEIEDWMTGNQEEAAQILEDNISYPSEQFLQNFPEYELSVSFKSDTLEHLNDIKEWAIESGLFEKDYDFDDFVDTSILQEVYPDEVDS